MQGKKDYQEKLFTSFQLSDRVPPDNFYRRLKDILDLNFLYKETKCYYGTEGQQSIDPVVFFKLILVGYFENLNSDRKIIQHACMRLDILFFIGYDIDEDIPWHSTLSRTRQLYGEEIFKLLFKKVLGLCIEKHMVAGKRQALDNAFIKANASLDSLVEKEVLDDSDVFVNELNANDDTPKTVTASRKKAVEQHHHWKEREYKDMPGHGGKMSKAFMDNDDERKRPKFLSNHTHYSTTDPDARISVKPGKPRQLNYSAQTCVDTRHHVITNIMADFADKRDSQSLPQAIEQTQHNLQEFGLDIEEVLADTAYSSGTSLKYLKENSITGYIPNFGQYKPHREGFIYNKAEDRYECTMGNKAILPFRKIVTDSKGYTKRIYRSDNSKCKECPLRSTCIGKSDFKKLDDSIDKPLYDEMHERLKTAKAKRMKKIRHSTVEPVLGTLINFTAMRRVWTRGIKSANKFMIGAAIAYNLKKYLKFSVRKTVSCVVEIKQRLKTPQINFKGVITCCLSPQFRFSL